MIALVVAGCALSGGTREALAAPTVTRTAPAESGSTHHCKCGPGCSGSCCCAKKAAKSSRKGTGSTTPASRDGRPCVESAPCGDNAGLPGSSAGWTTVKSALLNLAIAPRPALEVGRLVEAERRFVPFVLASRLDDPPEAPARR